MIISLTLVVIAYLFGSVASAIIVCRLVGLDDPRIAGSGNPGATNVMRLYGKKPAFITLASDVLKGVIPVLLAVFLQQSGLIIATCGLAAFTGHLFPVFFHFKGGKGVATLIGVLIASDWLLGLAYVLTWLASALLFRYSSLSALIAAAMMPIYSWFILQDTAFLFCHGLMSVLLFWRHQSNIRNLLSGKEDRIGEGKATNLS